MEKMNPLRPYERHDTLKQFLDHDHEVLHFNCYWDETESGVTQDFRKFILYYFLGDDTIKIQELFPPNCGRHYLPTFLRRSKLPKVRRHQLKVLSVSVAEKGEGMLSVRTSPCSHIHCDLVNICIGFVWLCVVVFDI